jgi:penicillin amidase
MERTRRMTSGRLSEAFGDKTVGIDEFARTLGYRKIAQEAWEHLHETGDQISIDILTAYAEGVNDFIDTVNFSGEGASARLLPPEFYITGLNHMERWTP